MINGSSEAIMDALRHYQEETGRNDLINDLGMMDGRIVRLTDQPYEKCNSLKNSLKEQLLINRPGMPIKPDTRIDEYAVCNTKKPEMAEEVERKQPELTAEIWDNKIKKRLQKRKDKYKKEFEYIMQNLKTTLETRVAAEMVVTKSKSDSFVNSYTPDEFFFFKNSKKPTSEYYMSNAIINQYIIYNEFNNLKMKLPKKITRKEISNKETEALILEYEGQHDSEEFKQAFLNTTVNGKSTVRVADDFGLVIDKLEVPFAVYEALRKLDNATPGTKNKYTNAHLFTVICHVSPDPEVFGNLNEMD